MKKTGMTAIVFIALLALSSCPLVLKTQAAEPGNRFFSVTFAPTAVDVSQTVQFTVLVTNDPTSQDNIGSINLTIPTGFTGVTQPTIISPSGNWITVVQTEAKIGMKPSSPQEALPPGQTISMIFFAETPALPSASTWKTECTTNTGIGGIPFTLAPGAEQPVIVTNPALVAPSINAFPNVLDQGQVSSLTSSTVTTGSAPYTCQWFKKAPADEEYSKVDGGVAQNYVFSTSSNTAVGTWGFLLQVTDSTNQAVNSSGIAYVVVNPALVAPIVTVSASTIIQGQSSSLTSSTTNTGTTPYAYQWFQKSPSEPDFVMINDAVTNSYAFSTTDSTNPGGWSFALRITDATGASVISKTVTVTVDPGQYTITASAGPNGMINPNGPVQVNNGADQVFTITPDDGYYMTEVLVDGISVGPITSYKFTAVTANHTIKANFVTNTFTITVVQGSNGMITPGTSVVNYGDTPCFTLTPDAGYQVNQVFVDGAPVYLDYEGGYTFPAVHSSHVITATYTIKKNIITASAGPNGAISPNGNVSVDYGADQSFTITPASSYHTLDVLVDGISMGPATSYTFANVVASHSIQAIFEIDDLVIIASAGLNGMIYPSETVYVGFDGSQTFTITPAAGYQVADIRIDGNSIGAKDSYTFSNVVKGHTIYAIFAANVHAITASAGLGGQINPSDKITVSHGMSQSFEITADSGYHIDQVIVDGISVSVVDSYTFNSVVSDHTIHANFAVNKHTITVTSPHGSPTASGLLNEGTDFTASVTSPEGDSAHRWICTGYNIDGGPVNKGTSYTFFNVQANHIISFNWQEQYYVTINSPDGTTTRSGWFNSSAIVTLSVIGDIIAQNDGTRQVFNGWSGDASGTSLTSNPMQIDGPKTVTVNWKTQHYLTVTSERGNPTGQGWYDAGATAAFSVSTPVSGGSGVRFIFNSWRGTNSGYSGSEASAQVLMDEPISETATWTTQYQVAYATSGNTLQVSLPANEWINSGAAATGKFAPSVTNTAKDTRCVLAGDNRPVTITGPLTITGAYQTQYLVIFAQEGIDGDASGTILTVSGDAKNYMQLSDSRWVNRGDSVAFSFTETVETSDAGKQYVLKSVNATSPLTIDEHILVQGIYETQTSSSLSTIALSALLLLSLVLLALLLLARRRKKKITPIADEGGSISPGTIQKVERGGDSPTFQIVARAGYEIADVIIDRVNHLGAIKSHQFKNVTTDHVISASFQKI